MSNPFYLSVQAARQGVFHSESAADGHSDRIEAFGYSSNLATPFEPAQGLITGRTQHGPVTFWKAWGDSSPQFAQALLDRETLASVTMEFFRTSGPTEALEHVVVLTNATVVGVRSYRGAFPWEPGGELRDLEEIVLVYQHMHTRAVATGQVVATDWGRAGDSVRNAAAELHGNAAFPRVGEASISQRVRSGIAPAHYLTISEARLILEDPPRAFAPLIKDVTLSGAAMNAQSVFLELNQPTYVDGNTGEISFMGSGGPCGGEVYVRLLGLQKGATYLGQMRCAVESMPGGTGAVAVNVFGGAQGTLFSQVQASAKALAIPFVFVSARGPVPMHEAGDAPMVAFHPVQLSNWYVHDIRVQKIAES